MHGAMCVSFSGRCLLSQYMVNRDANRGECAQPCRWGYHLMEEKRPNEFYPVYEDERGTYILNAKDLCMIDHIDKLVDVGVTSFKIEGRAKSAYYVSVITNAYRMAVDHYKANPDSFELPKWIRDEVFKVSHRKYCTGFFFGNPKDCQYYETGGYIREYDIVGVIDYCKDGKMYVTQRNRFFAGDIVEIISPQKEPVEYKITVMYDGKGEAIDKANHAMMKLIIPCEMEFPANSIIRMKKTDSN